MEIYTTQYITHKSNLALIALAKFFASLSYREFNICDKVGPLINYQKTKNIESFITKYICITE